MLRYQEKLLLNKKGYNACFKSITRVKRDHLLDTRDKPALDLDKMPPVGQYKPKYNLV